MTYGFGAVVVLLLITLSQYITIKMENTQLRNQLEVNIGVTGLRVRKLNDRMSTKENLLTSCQGKLKDSELKVLELASKLDEIDGTAKGMGKEIKSLSLRLEEEQQKYNLLMKERILQEGETRSLRESCSTLEHSMSECNKTAKLLFKQNEKLNLKIREILLTTGGHEATESPRPKPEGNKIVVQGGMSHEEVENDLDVEHMDKTKAQLTDVDFGAVKVDQVAMRGNKYHKDKNGNFLPLMVLDPPNAHRPMAMLSVMNLSPKEQQKTAKKKDHNDDDAKEVGLEMANGIDKERSFD